MAEALTVSGVSSRTNTPRRGQLAMITPLTAHQLHPPMSAAVTSFVRIIRHE